MYPNYPQGAYPSYPPGAYPPTAYPPGASPPGAYPPTAYPPGAYPPGAYPSNPYPQGGSFSYPNLTQPPVGVYPQGPYPPASNSYPNITQPPVGVYPQGPYPPANSYPNITQPPIVVPNPAILFLSLRYPYPETDPIADAHKLYKSMKGLGTDDCTLIDIMTHRSKRQLEAIAQVYARDHKNTLEKDIKGDTSGNYCRLLCDIAKPVIVLKVEYLQNAIRGLGTRDKVVIDVITQSTNEEIVAMRNMWPNMERDVYGDTSGNYRHVLGQLMKAKRQEGVLVDEILAARVANDIYRAGEKKLGTDDCTFVEIMTTYSPYFLERVSHHYANQHGHSLQTAIEKETSGDYKDALIACTLPPDVYFAHRIHRAIKGLGTDDVGLIYAFAIHDKAQLQHIAKVYEGKGYGSLARDIEGDTSGNYRKTLLGLLN